MSTSIDFSKPVLVTGGTGYVASWIVKVLLEKGFHVRTTVRDIKKKEKYQHLQNIAQGCKGKIEFFEADLLKAGSFKEAMQDCELVFHTASPFKIAGIKNAQKEIIDPALEGTRNVLQTVNETPSVKRVVLTASIASIYGDAIEIRNTPNGCFTENDWNNSSNLKHQPYPYSKTVAEKLAWEISKQQDRWDLITIHPGFVLGPSLTTRDDSTSIFFMLSFFNGKFRMGVPDLYFGIVDVRDIATVQVATGLTPSATGRYVAVSESLSFVDLAKILHKEYSDKYPIPSKALPKLLLYMAGPSLGFTWKYIKLNLSIPIKFDNSRSKNDLGISYLPVEKTLLDHAGQLIHNGLIKKK